MFIVYRIYVDDKTLYHPVKDEYALLSAELDLEVNKAGSLTLSIPKSNPHYGLAQLMRSVVTVYDDEELIFRGRPYAPNRNLFEDNTIICEGELAFLNDSIQEPFDYSGDVATLFTRVIEKHNEQVETKKQFKVGVVSVANSTEAGNIVRSDIEYQTTWDFISEKFIDSELGGYLYIRHEDDGNYIDYRNDLNFIGNQSVKQGINLIEVEEQVSTDELATIIVPLGAKIEDEEGNETDEYLTVESVNSGSIFISDPDGIAEYGSIIRIVKHDDIHEPSNLLIAGQKDLAAALGVATTVEITAADLSKAGYKDLKSFRCGTYVDVKIKKLGFDKNVMIKHIKLNLLSPGSNSITVGDTQKTFTAESFETSQSVGKLESNIGSGFRDNQQQIQQIIKDTSTKIDQSIDGIRTEVSEKYYPKDSADELIQSINTRFEQTSNSFEFTFEGLRKEIEDIATGTNTEFEEWKKFIRFIDGAIHLGKVGNAITLTIEHDRISFKNGGYEEAYLSNEGFFVRDGRFLYSIQVGDFKITVETDGSASFGKVGV